MDGTTLKCPNCGEELTEALRKELEKEALNKIKREYENKYKRLEAELLEKTRKEVEEEVTKKYEADVKRGVKELEQTEGERKKLVALVEELTEKNRGLKNAEDSMKLEYKRKWVEEEEKIKDRVKKEAFEENELVLKQKDRKIQELRKQAEELKRRASLGSQEAQGEVLEDMLEKMLQESFPMDGLEEISKGTKGADILQKVVDKGGKEVGSILWESKNTKAWQKSWLAKARADKRSSNAGVVVIVTVTMPLEVENFGLVDGVWVASRHAVEGLATALRISLLELIRAKGMSQHKDKKAEIIWNYLTGNEFKYRIEAIVEAWSNMQQELEKERRWMETKWARQDKNIRQVIDQTHGMFGDLQSMVGKSLPQIKSLELPESTGGEQ